MEKASVGSIFDLSFGRVVKVWKSGKKGKTLLLGVLVGMVLCGYFLSSDSYPELSSGVLTAYRQSIRLGDVPRANQYTLAINSISNLKDIKQLVGSEHLDYMLKANRHFLDACNKYLLGASNKRKQTGYTYRIHDRTFDNSASSESRIARPSKQLRDLGWERVAYRTFSIEKCKLRGGVRDNAETVDTAELFMVKFNGRWKIIR